MLFTLLFSLLSVIPSAHAAPDCQGLLNTYLQQESAVSRYALHPTALTGDAFEYDLACRGAPNYASRDQQQEARLLDLEKQLVTPLLESFTDLEAAADAFTSQCPGFVPAGGGEPVHVDPKAVEDEAARAFLQQLTSWAFGVQQNATMGREYVVARVQSYLYQLLLNNGYLSSPIGGDNPYLQNAWRDYADVDHQAIQKAKNHDLRYTPDVIRSLWQEAANAGAAGLEGAPTPENPDGVLAGIFSFLVTGSNHIDVQATRGSGSEDANYDSRLIMYSSRSGTYGTQYDSSAGIDIGYTQGHLTAGGRSMTLALPLSAHTNVKFDLRPCDASPNVDLIFAHFGAATETWLLPPGPPVALPHGWMDSGSGLSLINSGVASYSGLDGATATEIKLPLSNGSALVADQTLTGSGSGSGGTFTVTLKLQVHQGQ